MREWGMSTFGRSVDLLAADDYLARYLDAIHEGDRRRAVDIALELLERGASAESVISGLLARAQAEVGLGWQRGQWSVALEHRASAIVESTLQAVVDTAMSAPGAPVEGSRGQAVVSCVEGEWHSLPGRMAAETVRLRGVDVTFIGPSVPAEELGGFLGTERPPAVAIACAMSMSLVGAWRTITQLRALGMTVVCGGRGFGPHGEWALALGADEWAPDFGAGADLLMAAMSRPAPPPRGPMGNADAFDEVRLLALQHRAFVEQATEAAFRRWPDLRDTEAAVRATRSDLDTTLKTVMAATVVGSRTIVTDYVEWFESVLSARQLPLAYVSAAFDLLLEVLPQDLGHSRDMAAVGLGLCKEPPLPG